MKLIFPRFWCLLAAAVPAAAGLTVHEWGTFTTVSGSDGRLLPGLEVEEENLPNFVHGFPGFSPYNKAWNRPVRGVTVKMETPVIYFYSHEPATARVEVAFTAGSISQWYPERVAGETMPPPPASGENAAPVDFSQGYRGGATWRVDILARDAAVPVSAPPAAETPQWPRARVAGANRVRGPKGEVEGFIFYRGLGHFEPPLRLSCDEAGGLRLENAGPDRIPFVFVLDRRSGGTDGRVPWQGALEPGAKQQIALASDDRSVPAQAVRQAAFPAALEAAGLTPDEARALLRTWRESYFERPGLRVFWIVPRAFTDRVLPMKITPQPDKVERVLVGRSEVLTPAFEAELMREFPVDGGRRWVTDRFFRVYAERARQLGVATPPVKF
ncbi:MAG TPA: hypothetical protein VG734_03745 [Lacunisphaera sp.]|nr:hypothetical protein [Lacunisphaera sp.]